MSAVKKAPITTHVLDTVTGLPAANIPIRLILVEPHGPSKSIKARTDADGRVNAWQTLEGEPSLDEIFANAAEGDHGKMVWALQFEVGDYFNGDSFWETIEIRFKTEVRGLEGERTHWHIPLLLSPWSYTTYRGS